MSSVLHFNDVSARFYCFVPFPLRLNESVVKVSLFQPLQDNRTINKLESLNLSISAKRPAPTSNIIQIVKKNLGTSYAKAREKMKKFNYTSYKAPLYTGESDE